MSLTVKNLAEGAIMSTSGAAPTILYPKYSPALQRGALIKSIVLVNVSSSMDTIQLKVRPASNSARDQYIAPVNLQIPWTGRFAIDFDISLSLATPEDQIIAWSTVIGAIEYVISGVERDQ
jgi:hypothetical protein